MENILAQAQQAAEEAEVFIVTSEEMPVQFEANRLKHIQSKQSSHVALRIIRNGRIGYAITTEVNHDSRNLIDAAVETAEFGTKAAFELPSLTGAYPKIEIFDPDTEAVPLTDMVSLGQNLIDQVRGHSPELLCDAEVTKGTVSVRILNSHGGQIEYKQSIFALGIEGQLIRNTDMLFVGEGHSSCHPLTETKAITEVVIRQLELAKNQATLPSKPLPVIFTPNGVTSALVAPLMAAFNGKTVLEGASPIGQRLGEQVFDRKLHLSDDPTIAYRPESRPADDEGVPSQCTPLIQEGKVANFIYDLQTAALAHTRSTGNGGRDHGGLPHPTPSAYVITPGKTTFDEMVSAIKEGIVIEHLMGAGQGNILSGDFSGNVLLGYKIENGKIVGRVKDTMVSGNIYQILNEISAIGSDTKWVGSSVSTPSLYCPSVSVASK